MTKNDEPKLTRAEYQSQQKHKKLFSKIFKRKNKKSASGKTDDDFLVFNAENENDTETPVELTTEEKIKIMKKKLNLGILTVSVLLVIIFLVLFFIK